MKVLRFATRIAVGIKIKMLRICRKYFSMRSVGNAEKMVLNTNVIKFTSARSDGRNTNKDFAE